MANTSITLNCYVALFDYDSSTRIENTTPLQYVANNCQFKYGRNSAGTSISLSTYVSATKTYFGSRPDWSTGTTYFSVVKLVGYEFKGWAKNTSSAISGLVSTDTTYNYSVSQGTHSACAYYKRCGIWHIQKDSKYTITGGVVGQTQLENTTSYRSYNANSSDTLSVNITPVSGYKLTKVKVFVYNKNTNGTGTTGSPVQTLNYDLDSSQISGDEYGLTFTYTGIDESKVYTVLASVAAVNYVNITLHKGNWGYMHWFEDDDPDTEDESSNSTVPLSVLEGTVLDVDWHHNDYGSVYCYNMVTTSGYPGGGTDTLRITSDITDIYPATSQPSVATAVIHKGDWGVIKYRTRSSASASWSSWSYYTGSGNLNIQFQNEIYIDADWYQNYDGSSASGYYCYNMASSAYGSSTDDTVHLTTSSNLDWYPAYSLAGGSILIRKSTSDSYTSSVSMTVYAGTYNPVWIEHGSCTNYTIHVSSSDSSVASYSASSTSLISVHAISAGTATLTIYNSDNTKYATVYVTVIQAYSVTVRAGGGNGIASATDLDSNVLSIENTSGTGTGASRQGTLRGGTLSLAAVASEGYRFVCWSTSNSESDAFSYDAETTYVLSTDGITLNALFAERPMQWVTITSDDHGHVDLYLNNVFTKMVTNGDGFSQKVDKGVVVKIQAYPDTNYWFAGWQSGSVIVAYVNPLTQTVNENRISYKGRFTNVKPVYIFKVKSYSGGNLRVTCGSFSRLVIGDDSAAQEEYEFEYGSVVTVTPIPASELYEFGGYTSTVPDVGPDASGVASWNMYGPVQVLASWYEVSLGYTFYVTNSAGGTVQVSYTDINGSAQTGSIADHGELYSGDWTAKRNTNATIQATDGTGYTFAFWGKPTTAGYQVLSTSNPLTFPIDGSAKSYTAVRNFTCRLNVGAGGYAEAYKFVDNVRTLIDTVQAEGHSDLPLYTGQSYMFVAYPAEGKQVKRWLDENGNEITDASRVTDDKKICSTGPIMKAGTIRTVEFEDATSKECRFWKHRADEPSGEYYDSVVLETGARFDKNGWPEDPEEEGNEFQGWFDENSIQRRESDIVPSQIPENLYAHWSDQEYVITLDPKGGTVSPTTLYIVYGDTYGTLPTPTRSGYTFQNWYYLKGVTQIYINSSTVMDRAFDHTLHAKWMIDIEPTSSASCYLQGYDSDGTSRIMLLPNVQSIEETNDASIIEISTLIYGFLDNFVMDVGTLQSFVVSIQRIQPLDADDPVQQQGESEEAFWARVDYNDQEMWSNGFWFRALKHFINGWQNLNWGYMGTGADRTFKHIGGFHFHYNPIREKLRDNADMYSDLYPVHDRNVFIKGNISFKSAAQTKLQDMNLSIGMVTGSMITSTEEQVQRELTCVIDTTSYANFKLKFPVGVQAIAPSVPTSWVTSKGGQVFSNWIDAQSNPYLPGMRVPAGVSNLFGVWRSPIHVLAATDPDNPVEITFSASDLRTMRVVQYYVIGPGGRGGRGCRIVMYDVPDYYIGYGGGGGSGGIANGRFAIFGTDLTEDITFKLIPGKCASSYSGSGTSSQLIIESGEDRWSVSATPGGRGNEATDTNKPGIGGIGGSPDGSAGKNGTNSSGGLGGIPSINGEPFELTVTVDGDSNPTTFRSTNGNNPQYGGGATGVNEVSEPASSGLIIVIVS